MSAPPVVTVVDPERMNLLGLMLSSLLSRRLRDPKTQRHARALHGDVAIDASGMQVTLRFGADSIEVTRDRSSRPHAKVRGSLTALLDAALGRHRLRHVLAGRLSASGKPGVIWHVLALMRA